MRSEWSELGSSAGLEPELDWCHEGAWGFLLRMPLRQMAQFGVYFMPRDGAGAPEGMWWTRAPAGLTDRELSSSPFSWGLKRVQGAGLWAGIRLGSCGAAGTSAPPGLPTSQFRPDA